MESDVTVALPEELATMAEKRATELQMTLADFILLLCKEACDAQR